jgi:hypothetical protein
MEEGKEQVLEYSWMQLKDKYVRMRVQGNLIPLRWGRFGINCSICVPVVPLQVDDQRKKVRRDQSYYMEKMCMNYCTN